MTGLSSADHSVSPPHIQVPRAYNAAHDLIERNLLAGRAQKVAYIDDARTLTFGELAQRVDRFGQALLDLGLRPEERVLLCQSDTIDFPVAFLGCIKAGIVPIAVNTLLKTGDYEFMLRDSRARGLIVSEALLPHFEPLLDAIPTLHHVIVSGTAKNPSHIAFEGLTNHPQALRTPAATMADDMCFWLYSSGSTGTPKGTVHAHASLIYTSELYARPVLGIQETDVVFSAAKLFFAYGLGNALTFPLAAGATAVLMAERPTPAAVFKRLTQHRPTIFFGVPTLYAGMLAATDLPAREAVNLRRCVSAGEALPADIGKRWRSHFGIDILDGIGSTEMLHIFLSNRPGEVNYGTTGKPVPGYDVRLIDDEGRTVAAGETGELQIAGPTSALLYWNNRERSRQTFQGQWTRSGDKYALDDNGYYVYAGRSDDMLKVSGMYVSPIEVESALITHAAVLEAAVIGKEDDERLIKPMAFVVLRASQSPSKELAEALKQHVKSRLAPFKYPRWIEFVDELPKTATGKIQRFKLRASVTQQGKS